jgi:di/tricarboxylate transporter
MKETLLSILGIVCCLPILIWIFRAFVVEPYEDDIRMGRDKDRAMGSAILSGIIVIVVLVLVGMCTYNPDPEHNERYDEYQLRREPRW